PRLSTRCLSSLSPVPHRPHIHLGPVWWSSSSAGATGPPRASRADSWTRALPHEANGVASRHCCATVLSATRILRPEPPLLRASETSASQRERIGYVALPTLSALRFLHRADRSAPSPALIRTVRRRTSR